MDYQAIIAQGETRAIEFKSDRGPLPDRDLIETIVCLANGGGGQLFLGVEDDGTVTGLHVNHQEQPGLLAPFIASRTVPPLAVQVDIVELPADKGNVPVAIIHVPASTQPIASTDGRLLVRYLDTRGVPGCRPLYPHELTGWQADRGQIDVTAQPHTAATWEDLDPVEFARLRRLVEENRGDAALLELTNPEVAAALGFVYRETTMPTLAGLLIVGTESALRKYLPTHEIAFQVLRGTDVVVNEFHRWPLLRAHEWLMQAIDVRNEERELMVDSFRVGIPRYDRLGVREAVNNALIHRDYGMLGAIHIQIHDEELVVFNPGGFVAGVRLDNLLVVAPRPRNPLLADIFKRIGLVERTGRGVDRVYIGQLRNGRPIPDYTRSTDTNVTVTLDSSPADVDFVLLSIRVNQRLGRNLRVEDLLALWEIWQHHTTTPEALSLLLQRDVAYACRVLEHLREHDITQLANTTDYSLAPDLRTVFPTPLEPQAAILAYVQAQGHITRRETVNLCGLTEKQAEYQLKRLVESGRLTLAGKERGAHYTLAK